MKKSIAVILLILSVMSYASCKDETKGLDACLQCCTDTTQAAQMLKENAIMAADLSKLCKEGKVPNQEASQAFYSKYKIEMSLLYSACRDTHFMNDQVYVAESYKECVKSCEEAFKVKKK